MKTISPRELNEGLDPANQLITAFVSYLARAGITLEPEPLRKRWRIPSLSDAQSQAYLSLRALPEWATCEQMQRGLLTLNLAYTLNPESHLAMSSVYWQGAPSQQPGAETNERLKELFLAYRPCDA